MPEMAIHQELGRILGRSGRQAAANQKVESLGFATTEPAGLAAAVASTADRCPEHSFGHLED